MGTGASEGDLYAPLSLSPATISPTYHQTLSYSLAQTVSLQALIH